MSPAKSPNISGFFATQTAIFLYTKAQDYPFTVAGDAAGKGSKAANKTLGVAGDVAKHSKKASSP